MVRKLENRRSVAICHGNVLFNFSLYNNNNHILKRNMNLLYVLSSDSLTGNKRAVR